MAADAAKSADKAANGIAQYIKNYLHSPGPTTWPAVHQALQLRAETGNLKARAIQDIWENEFIPPKRLTLAQFKARVARRQAELEKQ